MLLSAFFSFFYLDIHLRSFNDALMSSLLRIHSQYLFIKRAWANFRYLQNSKLADVFFLKAPFISYYLDWKKARNTAKHWFVWYASYEWQMHEA